MDGRRPQRREARGDRTRPTGQLIPRAGPRCPQGVGSPPCQVPCRNRAANFIQSCTSRSSAAHSGNGTPTAPVTRPRITSNFAAVVATRPNRRVEPVRHRRCGPTSPWPHLARATAEHGINRLAPRSTRTPQPLWTPSRSSHGDPSVAGLRALQNQPSADVPPTMGRGGHPPPATGAAPASRREGAGQRRSTRTATTPPIGLQTAPGASTRLVVPQAEKAVGRPPTIEQKA
jgi:hypothetical protein